MANDPPRLPSPIALAPYRQSVSGCLADTLGRQGLTALELSRWLEPLGRALAAEGFDGWIAFGDDRAVYGPDHVRYLADIEPHFEPVVLAALSDSAEATLLTGPETIGYAAVVTARAAVGEIVAMSRSAPQLLVVVLACLLSSGSSSAWGRGEITR